MMNSLHTKNMKKLSDNFNLDKYGLHVRMVRLVDAEFIVKLRTDAKLGRYIHATSNDVSQQIEWLYAYKEREVRGEDYYFVFESPTGIPVGVERIYDIKDESFTVGSWVFDKESPKGAAILSDIILKEIAWELFPEKDCLWDNMKGNVNVVHYALSYHPTLLRETETQLFFLCTKENFERYKKLYLRMLTK